MLNLNLLPPEEKQRLAYDIRGRAVAVIGGGLVAAGLVFSILLLPSYLPLIFQTSTLRRAIEQERRSEDAAAELADIEQFRAMNQLADALLRHSEGSPAVTQLFEGVFRAVPAGIVLELVSFQRHPLELTVRGFAESRAELLAFIRGLEQYPGIGQVSSPLANLIQETDIRFSLTASVE